jgi:hypothetical protein
MIVATKERNALERLRLSGKFNPPSPRPPQAGAPFET